MNGLSSPCDTMEAFYMALNQLAYIILSLVLIGISFFLFSYLFPFLLPFVFALILAVLIEPVVQWTQRTFKINRKWASPIIFGIFMLTSLWLIYILIVKIIVEFMALIQRMPAMIEGILPYISEGIYKMEQFYLLIPEEAFTNITSSMEQLVDWAQQAARFLGSVVISFAAGLPNIFIVTLIIIISFALISYRLPQLRQQFLAMFEESSQKKVNMILNDLNKAIVGFVRAQFIISFLTYLVTLLGLWIIGIKYALAISLIIVIVDILPILGTGAVIIPWAIFQLAVKGDQFVGIGLLILYVVIVVFRRIIEPKILGHNIGLGTLSVIISMYVGFKVFGGLGLFIGPVLFILFAAMKKAGMFQKKISF